MNISELRKRIIREEMEFPKLFAPHETRDYGLLFHNVANPESGDSNHAVIYPERINDLKRVLDDIMGFYEGKGLASRFSIYHPLDGDYFIANAEIFRACGYQFTICPDMRIMLLTEIESPTDVPKRLDIRRVETWNDDIARDVLPCVVYKAHFRQVIKDSLNENSYLFIGYHNDEAVSVLAFHVSPYGVTRFDEIGTAQAHRGKGYAREMNRFAAAFVREHHLPIAYQWPAHQTSEQITAEAGFRVAFTLRSGYATLAE